MSGVVFPVQGAMRMIRSLALLAMVLCILGWLGLNELERRWEQPLAIHTGGLVLTVDAGDSLRAVTNQLQEDGVMPYPQLLLLYGRWTGMDAQIKRGEYQLHQGMTALDLLNLLQSGKVMHYQVTLPEGITLEQALGILGQQEALEHALSGSDDERIVRLTQDWKSPEGLFSPDSYRYVRGDSDWQILQRAYQSLQQQLQQEWDTRDDGLPYETPYEALIMASIIERETGVPQEREQIAGVFVRRLQLGMRLQTDPTVIYGIEAFDGNLRRSHLADASNPYNTYRHGGLPPTPIALPGRAAIHAALHPAPGKTLYFVATGDGAHVFSATLAEHQRAVRKYQLRRKANYRSSPEKQ